MRLGNLLKLMCILTILALGYINLQMRIIDLAYQGKKKENHIRQLIEQNGNLTYAILTLKSSNNLGIKMMSDEKDMEFVDQKDVLKISTSLTASELIRPQNQIASQRNNNSILNILSFGTNAEAKGR